MYDLHPPKLWNSTEDTILTEMWNQGRKARDIAENLTRSRSSIIGRAHRLELFKRPSPIKRREGICARKGCGRELAVLSKRKYCSDQCSVKRERPDPIPLAVKELVPVPLYRDDKILATFSPTGRCVIDECNYLALNDRCYKHNGAELGQP